jgi:hypothetical protein
MKIILNQFCINVMVSKSRQKCKPSAFIGHTAYMLYKPSTSAGHTAYMLSKPSACSGHTAYKLLRDGAVSCLRCKHVAVCLCRVCAVSRVLFRVDTVCAV